MSHAFGPGNAFGAFAPPSNNSAPNSTTISSNRLPRRINSSGSFKSSSVSNNTTTNPPFSSHDEADVPTPSTVAPPAPPRSFSSILAPSLQPISHAKRLEQEHEKNAFLKGRPFVYSREFVLSLYDDDKARRRPLELINHELATTNGNDEANRNRRGEENGVDEPEGEAYRKPWALKKEWRNGEKELFATSIHPSNTRTRSSHQSIHRTNDSPSTSNTLDLASLGTLPRDRDRLLSNQAATTPIRSSTTMSATGLGSSPPSTDKESAFGSARRSVARTGFERGSNGGSLGITGGVLGSLGSTAISGATGAGARARESSSGSASKEPWQPVGRWRRGASENNEGETDKTAGSASRRFPASNELATDAFLEPSANASMLNGSNEAETSSADVSTTLEEGHSKNDDHPDSQHREQDQQQGTVTDADLDQHASSILGSLALDSDPVDNPLMRQSTNSNPQNIAPPGLSAPVHTPSIPDAPWQYRDPSGQIQGPFAPSMMVDWHKQGFFTLDLRVKRVGELEFETIENVIRRCGDRETFFISAPLQPITSLPPPVSHVSSGGWPLAQNVRSASPVVDLSQRAFGGGSPFYEPFGAASPSLAHQSALPFGGLGSRSASQSIDPWGSTPVSGLASSQNANTSSSSSWGLNGLQQQQQNQYQSQQPLQQPQQPDLFRDNSFGGSPFQQAQQLHQPQAPFYDQTQQQQQAQVPRQEWGQVNSAAPATPIAQPSWTSLLPQRSLDLDTRSPVGSPLVSATQSPIGPPAAVFSAKDLRAESATSSPTRAPARVAESIDAAPVTSPWTAVPQSTPVAAPIQKAVEIASKTSATDKVLRKATQQPKEEVSASTPATTAHAESTPAVEEAVSSSTPSKPSIAAPWVKDDAPSGPSLREIQEAEAREAQKRKQAARIQAAQANIQAAQRAAALEAAEQTPGTGSASWATPTSAKASAAGVATASSVQAAPWSKPKTNTGSGKTLKEIQEEEERRKKLAQAAGASSTTSSSSATGSLAAGRGYAAASSKPPAPWTTIAVKQPSQVQIQGTKTIIPGLPVTAVKMPIKGVTTPSSSTPLKTSPGSAIIRNSSTNPGSSSTTPSRSTPVRASTQVIYDIDNPPPPSTEFQSWTRSALKGLVVPSLDEFIQMLLTFPLEASEDVLEIISDSVYANSSTLDGRRFANEFMARRKQDAVQRYPGLYSVKSNKVAGGAGSFINSTTSSARGSNAGSAASEWSAAGGKKKKVVGGK